MPKLQCFCKTYHLLDDLESTKKSQVPCSYTILQPRLIGELKQLKVLGLTTVPLVELKRKDLDIFPQTQELHFADVPFLAEGMENGLLCSNLYLNVLVIAQSYGNLKTFPKHIFQCNHTLNLRTMVMQDHNISFLPKNAFGSAAKSLAHIELNDLKLRSVHQGSFNGYGISLSISC